MPWAIGAAVEPSQASTSTVIAGKVAGSTSCGTPVEQLRGVRGDGPARRRPGDDDAGSQDEDGRHHETDPCRDAADARVRPSADRHASREDADRSAADFGSGRKRSRTGRAAHTTTSPASSPTLVPNSLVWGAMSRVLATATRKPKTTRPTRPAGEVFGSVIMKNRKIRTSGEVTMTRQKSTPQTGANAQSRGHAVAGRGEHPDADRERHPERRGEGEQTQPPGDQQPAADDHRVGGEHPDVERRPPEVERLDPGAAEHDEGDDQPDVGRVEDVRAAVADDVLGQQRQTGDGGEDVPGVGVPGLVRRRPDDAQDQRDAAAGEHRAGRPDEGPALAEGQRDLDDRAGQDRRQDLRDADPEVEADLAEDVDRDDHRRDVQPRIADARQDERVRAAADRQRPGGHGRCPRAGTGRRLLGRGTRRSGAWTAFTGCASYFGCIRQPQTGVGRHDRPR